MILVEPGEGTVIDGRRRSEAIYWRHKVMSDIRCLVLDVDGVLTDGRLYYGASPEPLRAFHIHDGIAMRWFRELIGDMVILTGKRSNAVVQRAQELEIEHILQGSHDKLRDLSALLERLRLTLDRVAMIGDDLPDLPVLTRCGMAICPSDAAPEVRAVCQRVLHRRGGDGAVREAIEGLLRSAGRWEDVLARYTGAAEAAASAGTRDEPG